MAIKSHEMTSLQEFARQRKIREKRMKTRVKRKGYCISELDGKHLTTFQVTIYLKNVDSLFEAEKNAKNAIKAIRHKCGSIV